MLHAIARQGVLGKFCSNAAINTVRDALKSRNVSRCDVLNRGYVVISRKFCRKKYALRQTVVPKFNYSNHPAYSTTLTEFGCSELSNVQFEKISDETLDSLTEYFDELIEQAAHLPDADVSYGDGVLTVKFGDPYGTYVINRQTPNKQIWLSSPKSGPKRYDFINGKWIYKHDGKTLHELLNNEIPAIIRNQACFDKCSYSGKEKQATLDSISSGK